VTGAGDGSSARRSQWNNPVTLFDELRQEILHQQEQGDFPEWIVADILAIAGRPELYMHREEHVRALIDQIRGYDPYAGAGCFSTSCNLETIRRTLHRLSPFFDHASEAP